MTMDMKTLYEQITAYASLVYKLNRVEYFNYVDTPIWVQVEWSADNTIISIKFYTNSLLNKLS